MFLIFNYLITAFNFQPLDWFLPRVVNLGKEKEEKELQEKEHSCFHFCW
jgi:hypothetical protein